VPIPIKHHLTVALRAAKRRADLLSTDMLNDTSLVGELFHTGGPLRTARERIVSAMKSVVAFPLRDSISYNFRNPSWPFHLMYALFLRRMVPHNYCGGECRSHP
jgi:hypothetical protein